LADRWAAEVGIPFHEVRIETNGHDLTLVFSELVVSEIGPDWTPFTTTPPTRDASITLDE
jgi:hypothetical protein